MEKSAARKWLWQILRVAVTVGVLAVIFYRVPWHTTARLPDGRAVRVVGESADAVVIVDNGAERTVARSQLKQVKVGDAIEPAIEAGLLDVTDRIVWPWLIAGALAFAGAPFFQALRWRRLLRVQRVHLSTGTAVKLMWIGLLFNMFLLGAVGGDLVKAYYVTRHTHSRAESVITVLVDRIIGLLGLLWLSAAAILLWLITGAKEIPGGLPWAWMIPGVVVLLGGGVFYSQFLRRAFGINRLVARFGEGHVIGKLDRAVYLYRHHKRTVLAAFALTFVSHVFLVGSVYCVSLAVQTGAPLLHVVVFAPIVFVGSGLIPSIGGLGVQEYGFILFFSRLGYGTRAVSVALGLLVRLSQIVVSLPGAVLLMVGGHLPSRAEMKREMEESPEEPAAGRSHS